jgi:photosynthetic reaction center cytochrome c subunit
MGCYLRVGWLAISYMGNRVYHCVAVTAALIALTAPSAFGQTAETKTAEQVYKNIIQLKGTPADQLLPAMQFIAASLGVECNFCHVRDKNEADDKRPKKVAREMMAMTMAINKNSFEGQRQVTCVSCHHGSSRVVNMPPVLETDPPARPEAPANAAPAPGGGGPGRGTAPSADPIIEKYVAAIGGADALKKITTRVEKGKIIAGGRENPIEVIAKAPNKRISINHTTNGESITAFDGTIGWLGNTGRPAREMAPAEAWSAGLDADFYFPLRLKETFQQLRVGRPEKIGEVECVSVNGMRQNAPLVRLFFDSKTGLLVRLIRYTETPLGRNPVQIDYADYREVDGVKIPFRWTLSRINGRFTIQIDEARQNVPVEDSRFTKPAAAAN